MREFERSAAFKRDYKRATKRYGIEALDLGLLPVITALAVGKPPAPRHFDHPLKGEWENYRNCHVKPDLMLIYSQKKPGVLRLARLGSHADLF